MGIYLGSFDAFFVVVVEDVVEEEGVGVGTGVGVAAAAGAAAAAGGGVAFLTENSVYLLFTLKGDK